MADLQSKYQVLATEYAKVRAQISVLKKAVLDEQSSSQGLKEQLKERDQMIRKHEQELESLTFRNQQLESRVTILQTELSSIGSGKNKKKNSSSSAPSSSLSSSLTSSLTSSSSSSLATTPSLLTSSNHHCHHHHYPKHTNDIIDEELFMKIEENARLHKQVTELDNQHHSEISILEMKIKALQTDLDKRATLLDDLKLGHEDKMKKLMEEKNSLESKLAEQSALVERTLEKTDQLEKELNNVQTKLTLENERLVKIINDNISFIDNSDETLTIFNLSKVPHFSPSSSSKNDSTHIRDLIFLANQIISEEMMTSFEAIFDAMQAKSVDPKLNSDLFKVYKEQSLRLAERPTYIQPIRKGFATLCDLYNDNNENSTLPLNVQTCLASLSSSWSDFVDYVKMIISSQLQCLEAESMLSSTTPVLLMNINELNKSFVLFADTLTAIQSCLSSLTSSTAAAAATATAAATPSSSSSSSNATILELSNAIYNWMEATNDLSRSFGAKLKTVEELPTCHKNIKLLDERLNGSIIKLHHSIQKLSSFLSLNVNQISSSLSASSSASSPSSSSSSSSSSLNALRKKAINYLAAVSQNVPSDSVPHSIAVENKKAILACMESKSELTQQVSFLQDRLTKAQQEKEHWNLEAQLMTARFNKEVQKVEVLTKKVEELLSTPPTRHLHAATTTTTTAAAAADTTIATNTSSSSLLSNTTTATNSASNDSRDQKVVLAGTTDVVKSELGLVLNTNLGKINIVDRDERQPPQQQQQKQQQQRQVDLETEWDQTREKIVMENYERRISELIANLQLADSKALYFNSECKAIHKQLTSTNLDRERLRVDLVSSNDVMSRLKDELQTTTKNYEVQLSLMSEHLATMNEKLTSQKDEIDALKFNIQQQQQHHQQQQQQQNKQQQKQQHHHSPVATLLSLSGSGGGSKKSK